MGVYNKLLCIQKAVDSFTKDKKTFQYKYTTGDQVLNKIRPLMNEKGLLLKQEILSIENDRIDYKTSKGDKSEILTKAMMRFTWVDTETGDKDENLFGANGMNNWEQGLGSALTYAERYFLLKYFHVPTDEDDVDNDKRKNDYNQKNTKKTNNGKISEAQTKMLKDLLEKHNVSLVELLKQKKLAKLSDMSSVIASKAIKYYKELK